MEDHETAVKALHETEKSLVPFVCPLYAFDRFGVPTLLGSSILLKVGDLHLLVTAAHVLQDASSNLFFAGPTFELEPLKHADPFVEAKWDFAFLRLHDETVNAMSNFSFWRVEDSDPNDQAVRGHLYTFIGFPQTRNQTKISAKFIKGGVFAYAEGPVSPAVYRELKVQEAGTLLIKFNRKKVVGSGRKLEIAPDLHGISGGGAWRVDRLGATGADGASLVGVCVQRHPREKALEAVRISLVFEVIRRAYPAYAEAIPKAFRFSLDIAIQEGSPAPNPGPQADS